MKNEKNENWERNVRGSCVEGPETWSRCNLRAPKKRLSLLNSYAQTRPISHTHFRFESITEILSLSLSILSFYFLLFLYLCLFVVAVISKFSKIISRDWREDGTGTPRGWAQTLLTPNHVNRNGQWPKRFPNRSSALYYAHDYFMRHIGAL